jgi:predicted Zn-dependent protease
MASELPSPLITRLRAELNGPRDGALLRFSLGNALLSSGDAVGAAQAFRAAVGFDPQYSAAWKLLGKALEAAGDADAAAAAYESGIAAAQARGDKQAEKEMAVFLRRLRKGG